MTTPQTTDLKALNPILANRRGDDRSALIPTLLDAQDTFGYLTEPIIVAIGHALNIPLSEIHGVIEFYSMLYRKPVGRSIVQVCTGPVCSQLGSEAILEGLCEHFNVRPGETSSDGAYTIEEVPCLGLCDHAPAALIDQTPVGPLEHRDPISLLNSKQEVPYGRIGGGPRWLSARCRANTSADLDAYLEIGGFAGLKKALTRMNPKDVIAEVKESGLVGRGGAAFPTGLKWEFTSKAESEERYIVCNGDESEPGTFKDRILMEGDPFLILEGMSIAGYAIGARKGFIYIRGEYARAQKVMAEAIGKATEGGYLGANIQGTNFSFNVELRSGAGAYVCGEETALFESIEGKRGMPRLKPPYPTTSGLFGRPTMINNAETLCAAAWIVANGAEAYRSEGTAESPGVKLFCLSGDVKNPGVYEAPFGAKLYELVDLAGGVSGVAQAFLIGGAAGTYAKADELDLKMSFEGLRSAGHALGSGAIMVINQDRDLRESLFSVAKFFAHESCGKCFPCRLGTQRQFEIAQKIKEGKANKKDILALRDIEFTMRNASICGLGMAAGSAILSAVEKWPELLEAG
jgi:NADH-quinone oxidoreductase subunit F